MITKPKNGSVHSLSDYPNDYWCIVDANGDEAASVKIEPPPVYTITVSDQVSGGTVDVPDSAIVGDTVQLKVAEGSAEAVKWKVTENDGTPVTISDTNTFIMPAADVTVFAWFANPKVTIEFGEGHADFAAFYRQNTGWGGTGSQATFSIDAGQTVGDARALIMNMEAEVETWLTNEKRYDQGEYLDINTPYSLKTLTSYTDRSELDDEVSQIPLGDFTLYAPWLKPAGNISVTVVPVEAGTTVGTQGSGALLRTDPTVTATVTGNASQSTASGNNWFKDESFTDWLSGTVAEGQTLYAQVRLEAKFGYYFDDIENSVAVTSGTIQKTDFNGSTPGYLTVYIVLPPAAVVYSVVSVENAEHVIGEGRDAVITVKRSVEDERTYSLYSGALVDGNSIPEGGSSAAEGSLVLTLKSDYLDTLETGTHQVTISFSDGTANTSVAVKASQPTETATPTAAPTATATPSKVPKTGDSASPLLWLGMILLGLTGACGIVVKRRRKR